MPPVLRVRQLLDNARLHGVVQCFSNHLAEPHVAKRLPKACWRRPSDAQVAAVRGARLAKGSREAEAWVPFVRALRKRKRL